MRQVFVFQTRPQDQQSQQTQENKRDSSVSQGSAGSEGSARGAAAGAGCAGGVEPDPEWAPHVDLGKQLATLHALLVDSLPKLPQPRIQVYKTTRHTNMKIYCSRHRCKKLQNAFYLNIFSYDLLKFPGVGAAVRYPRRAKQETGQQRQRADGTGF